MTGLRQLSGPLRLLLLAVTVGFAISNEIAPRPDLAPVAGVALLLWMVLEFRRMARVAQITVAAALLLAVTAAATGGVDRSLLGTAVGRAAFFTWFILSMDLLRSAALRSRMIHAAGRALVAQPPGRRYLMLTLGGHFFALLLNLGAVTLLGSLSRAAVDGATDSRIANIRLQRMSLAVLRGFAASTLWLPTSITVQVIIAAIPGYDWPRLAVQGAATATTAMTIGWLLDRVMHPRLPAGTVTTTLGETLARLLPIALLTGGILLGAVVLGAVTGLRLIAALLCVVPGVGLGWIAAQGARTGPALTAHLWARTLRRRVLPELASLRSEVAILASAGFVAVLLPNLIDTNSIAALVREHHLGGAMLLVPMIWLVPLVAPLGLNPIVSVAAGLEILVNLPGVEIPAPALVLAATVAWCMATGTSPLGATIRIMGRCIGRSSVEIGLVWNGTYTVLLGLVATAALLVMG